MHCNVWHYVNLCGTNSHTYNFTSLSLSLFPPLPNHHRIPTTTLFVHALRQWLLSLVALSLSTQTRLTRLWPCPLRSAPALPETRRSSYKRRPESPRSAHALKAWMFRTPSAFLSPPPTDAIHILYASGKSLQPGAHNDRTPAVTKSKSGAVVKHQRMFVVY